MTPRVELVPSGAPQLPDGSRMNHTDPMGAANEAAEHVGSKRGCGAWAANEAAEHSTSATSRISACGPVRLDPAALLPWGAPAGTPPACTVPRCAYRRVDLSGWTLWLYCRGDHRRGPYRHALGASSPLLFSPFCVQVGSQSVQQPWHRISMVPVTIPTGIFQCIQPLA